MVKRERCICQICCCGRHRCPHFRGALGEAGPLKILCSFSKKTQRGTCSLPDIQSKDSFRTTYSDHFCRKSAVRLPPLIRRNETRIPQGKVQQRTQNNTTNQGDRASRRIPLRRRSELRLPDGRLNGIAEPDYKGNKSSLPTTKYSEDFCSKYKLPILVVNNSERSDSDKEATLSTVRKPPCNQRRPKTTIPDVRDLFQESDPAPVVRAAWVSHTKPGNAADRELQNQTVYKRAFPAKFPCHRPRPAGRIGDCSIDLTHGTKECVKAQTPDLRIRLPPLRHSVSAPDSVQSCSTTYREHFPERKAERKAERAPLMRKDPSRTTAGESLSWDSQPGSYETTYQSFFRGGQVPCRAQHLLRVGVPSVNHTQRRNGHYFYAPGGLTCSATLSQGSEKTKLSLPPINTTRSSTDTSDSQPRSNCKQAKSWPQLPNIGSDKSSSYQREFVRDETAQRDGVHDSATNNNSNNTATTSNQPISDSNNNSNVTESKKATEHNNNSKLTRDLMQHEESREGPVSSVQLQPIFNVKSIQPKRDDCRGP